jgi:3-hydroxyisobutyrate dehydrogenase-like beta-hydroxyacid dehydrogenase
VIDRYVTTSIPGGAYFIPMMLERNHDTAVATVNSFSDVASTALSAARSTGLPTGVLEEMQKLFTQAIARGYGAKNGTAVCEVLLEPQETA